MTNLMLHLRPACDATHTCLLQVASVVSSSAAQGGAGFLDAAGAGLSNAGEQLQRAADNLPFR